MCILSSKLVFLSVSASVRARVPVYIFLCLHLCVRVCLFIGRIKERSGTPSPGLRLGGRGLRVPRARHQRSELEDSSPLTCMRLLGQPECCTSGAGGPPLSVLVWSPSPQCRACVSPVPHSGVPCVALVGRWARASCLQGTVHPGCATVASLSSPNQQAGVGFPLAQRFWSILRKALRAGGILAKAPAQHVRRSAGGARLSRWLSVLQETSPGSA